MSTAVQTITLDEAVSLDSYILFRYNSLKAIDANIELFITDITTRFPIVKVINQDNWFSAPLSSFIISIGVTGNNMVPTEIFNYCKNYAFGATQNVRAVNGGLIEITIKVY